MSEVRTNRTKNILIVVLAMAVVGMGVYFFMNKEGSLTTKESTVATSGGYQAVFLTNGQVYFGKLEDKGGDYIKLTDIYYLQAKDQKVQPKETNASEPDLTLIKLGKELHAPADEMNISREQVLFWEDITDDGKVMKAIKEYKETNK